MTFKEITFNGVKILIEEPIPPKENKFKNKWEEILEINANHHKKGTLPKTSVGRKKKMKVVIPKKDWFSQG